MMPFEADMAMRCGGREGRGSGRRRFAGSGGAAAGDQTTTDQAAANGEHAARAGTELEEGDAWGTQKGGKPGAGVAAERGITTKSRVRTPTHMRARARTERERERESDTRG